MDGSIFLFQIGFCTIAKGKWWIDTSKVVNRIYFVKQGSAVVSYGKKEYTLEKDNIYVLPASEDFESVSADGFEHIFFDYYSSDVLRFDSFIKMPSSFCDLDVLFEFVYRGLKSGNIDEENGTTFLNSILSIIRRNIKLPYVNNEIINKALTIIRSDIFKVTTKDLADKLHLNECYFIQLFKKNIGISPMKYIRSLRLNEGRELLKAGKSVTYVSEHCGYNNPGAFWKAIRREFGCTPTDLKT